MPQDESKAKPQGDPPPKEAAAMAEEALTSAQKAVSNLEQAVTPGDPAGAAPFEPQSFDKASKEEPPKSIDMLGDVNLNVKIELGRTRMLVEDVLRLSE